MTTRRKKFTSSYRRIIRLESWSPYYGMLAVNHAQQTRLVPLEPICISKESDGDKSRSCEILHQVETLFTLRKNF